MNETKESFEGWAVLELMGHRKMAGRVSEAVVGGASLLRIDVPGPEGAVATQFYSPSALYCLTPTTEEVARAFAARNQPAPVSRWELPAQASRAEPVDAEMDPYDDRDPF